MFWGASLVIIGVLLLLNKMELISLSFSEYLLPALLIAFGIRLLSRHKRD